VITQHASYQKVINGVMVASNQLGYISMAEETGFYPEFVVTINCMHSCLPMVLLT
jgi:hypothetical protein